MSLNRSVRTDPIALFPFSSLNSVEHFEVHFEDFGTNSFSRRAVRGPFRVAHFKLGDGAPCQLDIAV